MLKVASTDPTSASFSFGESQKENAEII